MNQSKYPAFFRLSNGSSPYGAQMGRRDILPADLDAKHKVRMRRICPSWEAYDEEGAYWGLSSARQHVYLIAGEDAEIQFQLFVRGRDRFHAKELVRLTLPHAIF